MIFGFDEGQKKAGFKLYTALNNISLCCAKEMMQLCFASTIKLAHSEADSLNLGSVIDVKQIRNNSI